MHPAVIEVLSAAAQELLVKAVEGGVKHIFGRSDESEAVEDRDVARKRTPRARPRTPRASKPETEYDPFERPTAFVREFLDFLAASDWAHAWALCDPDLPNDSDRAASMFWLFSSTTPIAWEPRLVHYPAEWRRGDRVGWVGVEGTLTLREGDVEYEADATIWATNQRTHWLILHIDWHPAEVAEA
jgi:hypothetical protein